MFFQVSNSKGLPQLDCCNISMAMLDFLFRSLLVPLDNHPQFWEVECRCCARIDNAFLTLYPLYILSHSSKYKVVDSVTRGKILNKAGYSI